MQGNQTKICGETRPAKPSIRELYLWTLVAWITRGPESERTKLSETSSLISSWWHIAPLDWRTINQTTMAKNLSKSERGRITTYVQRNNHGRVELREHSGAACYFMIWIRGNIDRRHHAGVFPLTGTSFFRSDLFSQISAKSFYAGIPH